MLFCFPSVWNTFAAVQGSQDPQRASETPTSSLQLPTLNILFFFFFFPAQLHMYVYLKLDIFITELTHFPELKIRVSLTICSCKCEW